jgi:hypothetical protein
MFPKQVTKQALEFPNPEPDYLQIEILWSTGLQDKQEDLPLNL